MVHHATLTGQVNIASVDLESQWVSFPLEFVGGFSRVKSIVVFFDSISDRNRRTHLVAPESLNFEEVALVEQLQEC